LLPAPAIEIVDAAIAIAIAIAIATATVAAATATASAAVSRIFVASADTRCPHLQAGRRQQRRMVVDAMESVAGS